MRRSSWICAGALLGLTLASASAAPAAPPASSDIQIASSAMLVLDARLAKHAIVLHIVRTANHTPIEGAGNVTAQIDGHSVPVTARGTAYVLPRGALKGGPHHLQVIVAHNGIHELLSGTVTLPKRPDRLADLDKHGYGAWWILNIVVMLLAARLIMKRKKPPPKGH